ncbi:ABC transporter permease [Malacoplasma muris]|uniref:ABC transporter permease n=1 Tax=Malacoplasma muris TaxID=2119 RepID=UPI00398F004E
MNIKYFNNVKKDTPKLLLLLPFFLLTLLLVVAPLITIVIKSLSPNQEGNWDVANNWNFIDENLMTKIFMSIIIALATSFFCLIIGYPFAYFLSLSKRLSFKILCVSLITSPIWISFLVRLVGLKTLFDAIADKPNSTYGDIFTIIALVYMNLPLFILTIYTYINSIPKNLLEASRDLGKNSFQTFFYVIVPYTKNAIISGLTLVFLPSITIAGVSRFMNNSNNGDLIGDTTLQQGQAALVSEIALARVSSLCLLLCAIILILFSVFILIPKIIKNYKLNKKEVKNA